MIVKGLRRLAGALHFGRGMERGFVRPLLHQLALQVRIPVAQRTQIARAAVIAADIVADGEVAEILLRWRNIAVPGGVRVERLLRLIGEVHLELNAPRRGVGQALDAHGGVVGLGTGGQLEGIRAVDRAMRADIEKGATAQLRRPHVAQHRTQIVQVAVVIGLQFRPAVDAVIEIVMEEDTA